MHRKGCGGALRFIEENQSQCEKYEAEQHCCFASFISSDETQIELLS